MPRLPPLLCLGCVLSALVAGGWLATAQSAPPSPKDPPPQPAAPAKPTYTDDVAPLLAKYCVGCHGGAKARAGVALDVFKDAASIQKGKKVWAKVYDVLNSGMMPPAKKPQPTEAEVNTITAWLDAEVMQSGPALKRDPGRVTIRRLNRVEYDNTIRDLVGVDFHPADDFPSDDIGFGFDNNADVLAMPPILMEKYLAAAEKVIDAAWKSDEARKRILIADVKDKDKKAQREAARKVLRAFADRAWRRPATDDEVKRLLGRFVDLADRNGDPVETGIQLALEAILTSPNFLFRIETDPEPNNPNAIHNITDWELASRLSYFLWSSMPDEELFRCARESRLGKTDVLEAQVHRMLKDPKSRALAVNFGDQWLQIRGLKSATPDPALFPTFDEPLRAAMQEETERFFDNVLREDRSILDFLDADYTFVNKRLAQHYGIDGVNDKGFQKVTLKDGRRGGVLTQASILTITSNPTRTSPVKRGKWILENILNTPPPPPPPDVPALKEDKGVNLSASLRERMEQHRADPTCASCHQRMDPLGFAFENFDAIGGWRNQDGKFTIDPSGVLPDGKAFKGPAELRAILKEKADPFTRCLTEKLLTYALGRGMQRSDRVFIEEIARRDADNQYAFSGLVLEIVKSDPFQKRRGKRGNL